MSGRVNKTKNALKEVQETVSKERESETDSLEKADANADKMRADQMCSTTKANAPAERGRTPTKAYGRRAAGDSPPAHPRKVDRSMPMGSIPRSIHQRLVDKQNKIFSTTTSGDGQQPMLGPTCRGTAGETLAKFLGGLSPAIEGM